LDCISYFLSRTSSHVHSSSLLHWNLPSWNQ
jgi:hypothetical protein